MPYDLAQQLGLTEMGFKITGKSKDSAGSVVIKLPYVTKTVGVLNPDLTLDGGIEACRKEEADLRRKGWVDHPSKIRGLPVAPAEQPLDPVPLPDAPQNQSQAVRIKEAVNLHTAAQQATAARETSPLIVPAESNPNQTIKRARGGRWPGAGRKPKIATAAR